MKVFYSGERFIEGIVSSCHNSIFLDIEQQKWNYVDSIAEADLVCVFGGSSYIEDLKTQYKNLLDEGYTNQLILFVDLFHIDEIGWHWHWEAIKEFYASKGIDNVAYTHNDKNFNGEKTIYNDLMFNRQKAYFTDYGRLKPYEKLWTYNATQKCFNLADITNDSTSDFIYISPNRIYPYPHTRNKIREDLLIFLNKKNAKGFISVAQNSLLLEPEETGLVIDLKNKEFGGGGTWFPIANKYYQKSFISIYVETVAGNKDGGILPLYETYRAVTEKTFDPLIKGHFILPFGYQGIVDDIKSYGFILPDFIDYSYDKIVNINDRFESFKSEIDKILDWPLAKWQTHYRANIDILRHNRELFFNKPYDSLYDKILALRNKPINTVV